jgi:hypothetical protein
MTVLLQYEDQCLEIQKKGGGISQYYIQGHHGKRHILYGYENAEQKVFINQNNN